MEASPAQLAAILNRSNTSNNPNRSDNATVSSAELVAILAKRPKLIRRTDPNNPSAGEGSESAKDQGASTPNNASGSSREELEALGMIFVTVILLICPDHFNNPNIPHNFNEMTVITLYELGRRELQSRCKVNLMTLIILIALITLITVMTLINFLILGTRN